MTDDIPQWAKERACELANTQITGHRYWRPADVNAKAYGAPLTVLARYIAEHEEPPVDPLLVEARKLASELSTGRFDFISGKFDDWYAVRAALVALKRGMELARTQSGSAGHD